MNFEIAVENADRLAHNHGFQLGEGKRQGITGVSRGSDNPAGQPRPQFPLHAVFKNQIDFQTGKVNILAPSQNLYLSSQGELSSRIISTALDLRNVSAAARAAPIFSLGISLFRQGEAPAWSK